MPSKPSGNKTTYGNPNPQGGFKTMKKKRQSPRSIRLAKDPEGRAARMLAKKQEEERLATLKKEAKNVRKAKRVAQKRKDKEFSRQLKAEKAAAKAAEKAAAAAAGSVEEKKEEPAQPPSDDVKDKQQKKKEKKAAKKAAAAASNVDGDADDSPDDKTMTDAGKDADTTSTEEEPKESKKKDKRSKKDKKKKKKAEDSEAQPAAEASRPAKKAKTVTSAPPANEPPLPTSMAAVGDRNLAKTRPPLIKALYTQDAEVSGKSQSDISSWREKRHIAVEGSTLRPIFSFEQSGLTPKELHATRNFASPSPIQAQCMPIVLSGRDVVGIAATGSGKTLAFGLPALRHIRAQIEAGIVKGNKPVALMLAPTRELALQISSVLEEAGSRCGINSICVYGGVPKYEQAKALRKGVGIIVATPGRLEDLMEDGVAQLDDVSYLVLDEADRMLDLGFEPHIRKIASATRADRQTLMFSATWPPAIRKLASEFLSSPARVIVGSEDLAANHAVKQIVEVVDNETRNNRLHDLLKKYHASRTNRIIVFVLYKKEADRVESMLQNKGWKVAAVHGDISQNERTARVEAFKSGQVPLLVATDVAARGLDIEDVEVVINYSFPLTTEDYVHRIGRTGRAGKTGVAHTLFVGANDKPRAGELINVLREAKQEVPEALLAFGTAVKKKESKLYGAHFKDIDPDEKSTKVTFHDSDSD